MQARPLAQLLFYLQTHGSALRTQAHLLRPEAIATAMGVQQRPSSAFYAHGMIHGAHMLVVSWGALAVFAFDGGVNAEASFMIESHRDMGRLPDAFYTAAELQQTARDNVWVHQGFKAAYEDLARDVTAHVTRAEAAGVQRIVCTGHSSGGALANLASVHIAVLARRYHARAAPAVAPATGALASVAVAAVAPLAGALSATLSALDAVSPAKRTSALRASIGASQLPELYFVEPLFTNTALRLVTFGAPASGNQHWVNMVLSAVAGDCERYVAGTDPVPDTPTVLSLLYRYQQPQRQLMALPYTVVDTLLPSLDAHVAAVSAYAHAQADVAEKKLAEEQAALVAGLTPAGVTVTVAPAAPTLEEQPTAARAGAHLVASMAASVNALYQALLAPVTHSAVGQTLYAYRCKGALYAGTMKTSDVRNHTLAVYLEALDKTA